MNVLIKNVDGEAFRRFKARCAERGMHLGEAVTLAIKNWAPEKKRKSILDFKPVRVGTGIVHFSERVDELAFSD